MRQSVAARWEEWAAEDDPLGEPASLFGGNEALPVTFPDPVRLLGCKVEIAPGADLTQPPESWQWADITSYVRHAPAITVRDGRKDEHALVEAGSGDLVLDNRDGRFSRRNPNSPYYPLLTKNTPIRASLDPGSGFVTRMEMFVNNWPNRSDKSGNDVTMPISCAGVLRRLGQGAVAKSPMRRTVLAASPTLYWPLEDGPDATSLASAVGGAPLTFMDTENIIPSGESRIVGASSCLALLCADNGGSLGAVGHLDDVPLSGFSSTGFSFAFTFVADFAPTPVSTGWQLLRYDMSDASGLDNVVVNIYAGTTSNVANNNFGIAVSVMNGPSLVAFAGYDSTTGSPLSYPNPFDGEPHSIKGAVSQSGADVAITLVVDGITFTGTASSKTLGTPVTLRLPATALIYSLTDAGNNRGSEVGLAHLGIWANANAIDPYEASIAYVGEQAHERIVRLATEDGLPIVCHGAPSTRMGPQPIDTLLNLLRESEAADLGVLYETAFGLGYQCRSERHNATVALSLDFNQGHISEPPANEDDDLELRNRWTVNRSDGAEATIEDAANIATNGLYDDSAEVNLYEDAQVPNAASWRVHLGITDEERWPGLAIDFASPGGRTVIQDWLALQFGARVQVANPPDTYNPHPVDAFIEGRAERWDPISWDADFNTSPAQPSEVYQVASTTGNRGRVDSASSTLSAAPSSSDTSLTVASTGTTWIDSATYPTFFPFDIDLRGEQVTVTAIVGTSSPQTFTVTRSVNGVVLAHPAATKVCLWRAPVYAM